MLALAIIVGTLVVMAGVAVWADRTLPEGRLLADRSGGRPVFSRRSVLYYQPFAFYALGVLFLNWDEGGKAPLLKLVSLVSPFMLVWQAISIAVAWRGLVLEQRAHEESKRGKHTPPSAGEADHTPE